MNSRLTELTEAFTDEGIAKLKVKQTLTFNLDGINTTYKIMKIKDGRIWGKETTLYKPEDIEIVDRAGKGAWKNKVR